MKPEIVREILNQVKNDYNVISEEFNQSRRELWTEILMFKKYVKIGDKVLDLGCGNGRLRLMFKDVKIEYIGIDNNQKLLELAEGNNEFDLENQKFVIGEMYNLPFADNSFDIIYCIAAFHHLPGEKLRLQTLSEIKRVLKPGGQLVMTNWNRWNKQYIKYIIKYAWLKIIGKNKMDFKDILVPWKNKKVERYYHVFTLGELKKLVDKSGLNYVDGFLSFWHQDKRSRLNYLKASNIVTIAKK